MERHRRDGEPRAGRARRDRPTAAHRRPEHRDRQDHPRRHPSDPGRLRRRLEAARLRVGGIGPTAIDSVTATLGCDPNALDPAVVVDPATIPAPDPSAAIAVAAALTGVASGGRYVAEGNGPIDFDCSGLTAWAWRQAGVSLVDYSYTQRQATTAIPRSATAPGDLVFWFGGDAHHVAIITAVDGDQITIAEAANPTTGLDVRALGGAWDDAHLSGFGRVTRAA